MAFEPERASLRILPCALKHGVSKEDIKRAWRNAKAMRYRNFDVPAFIAAAGADSHGELIELLGGEQENGEIVIYHAMRLTAKMAAELGL